MWTDDAGKLDYDKGLEDMVRDARVILAREVRHSILKITPGGDGEKEAPAEKPLPTDATSEALHERHVAAEHHEHALVEATVVEEEAGEPHDKR